uniref:Uncharacterized protein n=1 Tax=Leptobrachium leishanense TaxID=445787 RepID=A0A8C5QH37_9ANUR
PNQIIPHEDVGQRSRGQTDRRSCHEVLITFFFFSGLLGCICPYILPCYLSALFGEVCCFGLLPGSMFALRTGLRERYKIPGDLMNDYCSVCCCMVCALCQMAREIKGREWQHTSFPMPRSNFHRHGR